MSDDAQFNWAFAPDPNQSGDNSENSGARAQNEGGEGDGDGKRAPSSFQPVINCNVQRMWFLPLEGVTSAAASAMAHAAKKALMTMNCYNLIKEHSSVMEAGNVQGWHEVTIDLTAEAAQEMDSKTIAMIRGLQHANGALVQIPAGWPMPIAAAAQWKAAEMAYNAAYPLDLSLIHI